MWLIIYSLFVWLSKISLTVVLLLLLYKLGVEFREKLRLPRALVTEVSWRNIGYIAVGAAALFALRAGTRYLSDRQLHSQILTLSSEIIAYTNERLQQMPAEGQPNWDEYTRNLAQLAEESRSVYAQRFAQRVKDAREQLGKRGLRDAQLDRLDQDPSNPLVIRAVGERLQVLANLLH